MVGPATAGDAPGCPSGPAHPPLPPLCCGGDGAVVRRRCSGEMCMPLVTVAEWSRRAYAALSGAGGVGSIPANPDAQNLLLSTVGDLK